MIFVFCVLHMWFFMKILYLLFVLSKWKACFISSMVENFPFAIDQLLTALRYYASAGHLSQVADFIGMDLSTASRIIAKVTLTIGRLYPQFIKMPGPNEIRETNIDFIVLLLDTFQ